MNKNMLMLVAMYGLFGESQKKIYRESPIKKELSESEKEKIINRSEKEQKERLKLNKLPKKLIKKLRKEG